MSDSERSTQGSLVDVLENLIDKGVWLDAEIRISVADVDLIYVGLKALVCPADEADRWRVETVRQVRLSSAASEKAVGSGGDD